MHRREHVAGELLLPLPRLVLRVFICQNEWCKSQRKNGNYDG
jgi:hypothetical protein